MQIRIVKKVEAIKISEIKYISQFHVQLILYTYKKIIAKLINFIWTRHFWPGIFKSFWSTMMLPFHIFVLPKCRATFLIYSISFFLYKANFFLTWVSNCYIEPPSFLMNHLDQSRAIESCYNPLLGKKNPKSQAKDQNIDEGSENTSIRVQILHFEVESSSEGLRMLR